ncbi:MAG: hypothetical protein Q4C74_07620 [Rothia sp. (in: high G+C Gram-positive bacteria)]|nr:hypothetical protein [Rothia sp. (in: high G+C Gram-positive bacteria)]
MYGWIFRKLPGPLWLRIILCLALILLVVWALVEYAFPAFVEYSPLYRDVTVTQ